MSPRNEIQKIGQKIKIEETEGKFKVRTSRIQRSTGMDFTLP
jgi:hypothetical protein